MGKQGRFRRVRLLIHGSYLGRAKWLVNFDMTQLFLSASGIKRRISGMHNAKNVTYFALNQMI